MAAVRARVRLSGPGGRSPAERVRRVQPPAPGAEASCVRGIVRSRAGVRARLVAVLAVAAVVVGLPPTAAMAASAPTKPTGVAAVSVTSSGFTVTIAHHTGATKYRVYVSSVKSNVYVANIDATKSFSSSTPSIVLTGLKFRTVPYWFRVKVGNGTSHAWSDIYSVSLKPSAPTGVSVTTSSAGTWLQWSAGRGTGFQVVRATDPTLTQGKVVYTSRSTIHQFSPYPLVAGTPYYFAVRALNGSTGSDWSPVVSAVAGNSLDGLRVMSYNILNTRRDGTAAGDGVVGSWSQRAPGIVSLIRSTDPDVIAFQEGGGWVGPDTDKTRQVDDLESRLGGDYRLVRTETPPTEPGYFRTGSYVMIKRATVAAVGSGDHWMIGGSSRVGAYAELKSLQTGAHLLFVATHLTAGDADAERAAELTTLLADAQAEASARGSLPLVIAGDFNSHPTTEVPDDSVTVVSRTALFTDAITGAQALTATSFNSSNRYLRTPPATSDSVDHIFAAPGVAVSSFGVVLHLVGGKFSGVIPSDHNPVVSVVSIPY